MRSLSIIAGTVVVVALFTGCRGCMQQTAAPPPLAITDSATVDLPLSVFNLPVKYELRNFEQWINNVIKGKFLETVINPLNDERDEAILSFTKRGSITIRSNGKELICTVPLQAEIILTKSRLGKGLTNSAEAVTTVVNVQLSTPVSLQKDWGLVTAFRIRKIEWVKEPVFRLGPFKKNLTKKINAWVEENEKQLTTILDREISQSVSMRQPIEKVWNDLQKPMIINRKKKMLWLRFYCTSIEGKIMLDQTAIICQTKVLATTKMLTDTTALQPVAALPPYKLLKDPSPHSDIHLYAFTSFDEINDQLNEHLKGKTITAEGYSLDIKSVRAYASAAGISVEVKTGNDVSAKLVASGKLDFDATTLALTVKDFDYTVSSDNALVAAGDMLLHKQLKDTIASQLVVELHSLIDTLPRLVENAIAKGNKSDKLELNFEELAIHHCEISTGAEGVHIIIHAEAKAAVRLKKLKPGKKLHIRKR
ncbi:MAG: DUF4403 family protein [Chitinophagaceae bacterium]|nr:DUF4403 family protein [Chitinophagaceae bacterium]